MTDPEVQPKLTQPSLDPSSSDGETGRASWLFIIAAILIVIVALAIGIQVITVLYGIVRPPMPPMPENASEVTHSSTSYGVDDWQFVTEQDPCSVLELYQLSDAECHVSPSLCGGENLDPNNASMVARCEGQQDFSIFSMSYEVVISRSDSISGGTELRLIREVNWLGGSSQNQSSTTANP